MKTGLHLLLVFTLAVLAFLVARIEYYRGFTLYHQHQFNRHADMIRMRNNITAIEVELALEVASESPDDLRLSPPFRSALYHRGVAQAYHVASYQPWLVVHKTTPPVQNYED
jgi:hypothetical protein